MAETQKIYDEWSPAHSVARVAVAASGLFSRAWNSAQAMAKYFVRNEPEIVDLGALTTGNTALTAVQLKHGFQWQIAAGADQAVVLVMPAVSSLIAAGLRIGDVVEFWSIGTLGAPTTTSHTVEYQANGADTLTVYGPEDTAGTETWTAAASSARRVHLHITGANAITLIVQS